MGPPSERLQTSPIWPTGEHDPSRIQQLRIADVPKAGPAPTKLIAARCQHFGGSRLCQLAELREMPACLSLDNRSLRGLPGGVQRFFREPRIWLARFSGLRD